MSMGSTIGADALLAEQAQVLEQIVRGAPLSTVLAALCRIVESHATTPVRAAILLTDDEGARLHTGAAPSLPEAYCRAIDGIRIAPDIGTCCAAAAMAKVVITRDIAKDAGWATLKQLPLELGLVAAWSMPILSSSQHVLGTFGTYFTETREPTPQERGLIEVLARTAALAIERDRADRTLRETARRHEFLARLGSAVQGISEASSVMATTARMLAEHLDVERCAYAEIADERVFVVTGDHARGVPSIVGNWDVAAFGSACSAAMLDGTPFIVEDATTDPRLRPEDMKAYEATNIRAGICMPLHKDGRFTAAMAVHQIVPRRWTAQEIELVTIVVARCWEALQRALVTRELRESEQRYRTMVQATPECVKVVAADGTLLQMNAAGLRMVEATEGDALGSSVYDMIVPEHRERFQAFNESVCRGEPQRDALEYDIVGRHGTRRSIESTAVALPSTNGSFVHLAISRDISTRAAAARALEESRGRLDYAVRLSGVGFWYCDLPFDVLNWDERTKSHFFIPRDTVVTFDLFLERIHPEDREATQHAINTSIAEYASYDVVYRTVDPATSATKYIRALGGTAYAPDGTPKRFDGVTVDVTAQKLDEQRLARLAAAALRIHSASTLDNVLQVITEEARDIIGAHEGVSSLTIGDDLSQAITSVSRSENYAPADGAPITGEMHAAVCKSNRPTRLTPKEHPAQRGWLAAPFVGRSGANLGLVQLSDKYEGEFTAADEAVLVQLAQLAAVAIENARLYDQLREQDRRKDEFLATLAHELRNPLAPIRTGLQVLQQGSDEAGRIHTMMDRQLGHLVRMVDDLLDISRVTLGKVTLVKTRVDLRSVLDSALETTRPLVEAGGHELALRLPSEPLPLAVDPTRLSQVFANLVNNAAKYMPKGGRILITAEARDGMLHVTITDTGIGIPADMLPRVFDMFTQVGRSIDRSQGGLGIGLTLVRRLVEMHGGTVDAESDGVGKGSKFTVHLPLAPAVTARPDVQKPAPVATSSNLRILVVDDNVDAAEMLAMLLEVSGNTTRLAHTGAAALEAASEFEPDLVFLDIGLPEMNGYEVATRMRADKSLRQPVLVALTGWGSEEDRRQAHAAGFDRHLVKPIDSDKLHAVLETARSN